MLDKVLEKMLVRDSRNTRPGVVEPEVLSSFSSVDQSQLQAWVEDLAFPRDYETQRTSNREARDYLMSEFKKMGLEPSLQGEYDNVFATLPGAKERPLVVVGAHYDTVPETPGADDNGSAVSVMLATAKTMIERFPDRNIGFAAFNYEEHPDSPGSRDFARKAAAGKLPAVVEAHILEMVGFCSHEEGSQRTPEGFPFQLPDTGDFLGIVANGKSRKMANQVRVSAATYLEGDLPVMTLTVPLGLERVKSLGLADTLRSDHTSFWNEKMPSLMWTDTANFRNENYHQPTDTPDTLDYDFMERVSQVFIATLLARSKDV